jgi:two-component system chemotaxis response regulator CheB
MTAQLNNLSGQVIVIGTSAGGMTALKKLLSQLQPEFPVPILAVQHISADAAGNALLDSIKKVTALKCLYAVTGEKLRSGHFLRFKLMSLD